MEAVGRWRVGRTAAMRWDGNWAVCDQSARILRTPPARTPVLSERSGVTVRRLLGLASVADRQGFPYVSIRLAHRACAVRIAICFALVSDANALWYDDSTRLDKRRESDA